MDDILSYYGFSDGAYIFKDNVHAEKSADILNTLLTNTQRGIRLLYETVQVIRTEFFPPTENSVDELRVTSSQPHKNDCKLSHESMYKQMWETHEHSRSFCCLK